MKRKLAAEFKNDYNKLLNKYKKTMVILPIIIVLFIMLFFSAYMLYAVHPCNVNC